MNKFSIYKKRQFTLLIILSAAVVLSAFYYKINNSEPDNETVYADNSSEDITSYTIAEATSETDNILAQQKKEENIIYADDYFDSIISSENEIPEKYEIDIDCVYQNPELPTGCEITALTTVLNYIGYPVSKTEMAENYLVTAEYGDADFNSAFIGDPETDSGYGCYSPVIYKAAQDFLSDNGKRNYAAELSEYDLNDLFKLVANNYPVVIWVTISLVAADEIYAWTLDDGSDVYWMENEHCLVLTGYDSIKQTVTVSDPLKGITEYSMTRFEKRYNELGQQAVAIY